MDCQQIRQIRHWARLVLLTILFGLADGWHHGVAALACQIGGDDVAALVAQLDDRRFAVRKMAMDELARRGPETLEKLLMQFDEMSPEASWRMLKIVEAIGLAGDEAAFIKSAAILRTLSHDPRIDEKLQDYEVKWKFSQTSLAADHLQQLGARLVLSDDQPDGFGQIMMIEPQFGTINEQNAISDPNAINPSAKKMSSDEKRKQLEQIFRGDVTSNFRLAFPNKLVAADGARDRRNFVIVNQQLAQRRILLANGLMVGNQDGESITLDRNWRGTAEDFHKVTSIHGLTTVVFGDIPLTGDYITPLQRMSNLTRLRLEGTTVGDDVLAELEKLPSLTAIEVLKTEVSPGFFPALAVIRDLSEIVLELPQNSQPAWWQHCSNLKTLTSLVLRRMKLEDEHFETLATMRSLSTVFLEGCSFNIRTYKEFKRSHPELNIEFVPKAYLGVRSDFGANQNMRPCIIGEVVAGTGAAEAGMQTGDIVLQIAGQDIEVFEDLRLVVAQFEANQEVDVVVQRGNERMNLRIRLGDRSAINQ